MKDRAMQALHLLVLQPIAECTADQNSFGFRPKRSTADAMMKCQNVFAGRGAMAEWVLVADIKSCFDNISHDWLLAHAPMDTGIARKWLKAGFIESKTLWPSEAGTPQGGIISPTLANIALDGLEPELRKRFRLPDKVHLARYCDDFIISGRSKDLLENEVKPLVVEFLKARGLELSPEKTSITHIEQGFDFLGWNVRRYDGKLLIKPIRTARNARPWRWGTPVNPDSVSTVRTAICEPAWMFQRPRLPVWRFIMTTASRPGELPECAGNDDTASRAARLQR
jgi:RNA-directed DNA polymerase